MQIEGESEADRFARFRDSFARRISEVQKIVAALISMSSALIAIPILFFKDIFGETVPTGGTIMSFVLLQSANVVMSFFFSIFCFAVSIVFGFFHYYNSGNFLHGLYKYNYPPDYLESADGVSKARLIEQAFKWAVIAFLLGFLFMMIFALFYTKQA